MIIHIEIFIFFYSICFLNYGIAIQSEGCEGTRKFQCIFPFKFNGKTHNSCTKYGDEKLWCATEIDTTNSNLKEWGNCTKSCSTRDTGYFLMRSTFTSSILFTKLWGLIVFNLHIFSVISWHKYLCGCKSNAKFWSNWINNASI